MSNRLIIGLILLISGSCGILASDQYPKPEKGVMDLRNQDMSVHPVINLNGEWIFTWEEFTQAGKDLSKTQKTIPVSIPSYWNSYKLNGEKLPIYGYGSYELLVLLPEGFNVEVGIDIPIFDVAYRLYLNNELIASKGKVGKSRSEEEPWYGLDYCTYLPENDSIRILVHVSNFHHRRGGFWMPMVVGEEKAVSQRAYKRAMFNHSTIGTLFFFMIFFLIFWSFSRKEKTMLYFALATMGILARSVNTGEYFSNHFIDTSWSWQIRMEYLGSYLGELFGVLFLSRIFYQEYMKPYVKINTIVMSVASVSLFILPVRVFAYEMLIFQPLLLLVLVTYLVISLRDALKGDFINIAFLLSLSFFLFTIVNDILLANSGVATSSSYQTQISFQLFILAMAISVVVQWMRNQKEMEKLDASLRFKNRVLSVIAHDLKSPVASISQFTELLASKPELSSRGRVITSLQESSQAAVTLLDNLLYWGRNEADQLQISPASLDVDENFKEISRLYSHMLEQKEITFKCDENKGLTVYADPVVLHIVLRNLISNAIKFTRKGGKLELLAEGKGPWVVLSVRDNGVGIKAETLKEFKTSGNISSSLGTDQEIGTGLGLQLVIDLVRKSNGQLEIESMEGKGSTFSVTLPANNNVKL